MNASREALLLAIVTYIALLILAFPFHLFAEETREHGENASFIEFHDPGYLTFQTDGNQKHDADFFYKTIEFKDIQTWKKGETLKIVIDKKEGVGIIRNKTNKFYKLFFHADWHPIDQLFNACLKVAVSTIDVNDCHNLATQEWQAEQQFALAQAKEILASNADAEILRNTQNDWNTYKDKMRQAFKGVKSQETGSIETTLSALQNKNLDRSRYFEIMDFFNKGL